MKKDERSKRAKIMEEERQSRNGCSCQSSSKSYTPFTPSPPPGDEQHELQTVVVVGKQLSVYYLVHELPSVDAHHSVQNDLDQTLSTCIRYLEAENKVLKTMKTMKSKNHFRLDDKLVRFYNDFVSYFFYVSVF